MSTVVSVYSKKAYREYVLLPPQSNADFSIVAKSNEFWLENDLSIFFEVLGGSFYVTPDDRYRLLNSDGEEMTDCALVDGLSFGLVTRENEELKLSVRVRENTFVPFTTMKLRDGDKYFSLGSAKECDICYSYRSLIANEQAVIEKRGGNIFLICKKEYGTYVNGGAVKGEYELNPGDIVNIYDLKLILLTKNNGLVVSVNEELTGCEINKEKLIEYDPSKKADLAEYRPVSGDGLFYRAPRQMAHIETTKVTFEAPPELSKNEPPSLLETIGHSFLMILPMVAGSAVMLIGTMQSGGRHTFLMYSGLVMATASAITGVTWGIINIRNQRKRLKTEENKRFEAYGQYLIKKKEWIEQMYEKNATALKDMYPEAEVCAGYSRNDQRLWNRNKGQEDFLHIRLGIGDIPFQAEIEVPEEKFHVDEDVLRSKPRYIKDNFKTLYDVPLLINLKEHPLIGLVGGEDRFGAYELVRIMAVQLAATHCYTEVKMVFIYDEESSMDCDEWGFVRWLPHVWSQDRKIRFVAATNTEINDVCYELSKVLRERFETTDAEIIAGKLETIPHYIIFVSNPALIEGEIISNYLFQNNGKIGLTTIFLSEFYQDLPNECTYVIQNDPTFTGIKEPGGKDIPIVIDKLPVEKAEAFARRISGIKVKESGAGGELPERLTFLEMYGVSTVDELGSADRWLKSRIYENIRGILGYRGGSELCVLDIHEKYHGPHGLVAGTTGSGKSETLQTYLLSLAVNYSPDDMTYFIIDYKGGGMANLFENLPHLSGQISNLSGTQINRALVSIKAENRRRQRLFNDAGVNNINKYTKMYKNGEISEPIPHLIIVIDEFAELKREEPDFMRELISVAQVGRSLGVHLILATQKPSGTVDDNIWSNSKFRLCLRVQTKEDSNEMLGRPDAARIIQAGRGYLQVGNDELYEMFQSGYSGARYNPVVGNSNEATGLISRTGQVELMYVNKNDNEHKKDDVTQLDAVVNYLRDVAKIQGFEETHPLWMPILRNPMFLGDFEEYNDRCFDFENGVYRVDSESLRTRWDITCVVGQSDDPRNQAQDPLILSFADGGHHAVIGSVNSGKSTFMATVVYSLATTYSPELFQFYAIDYSSHMLAGFEALPHCGGILYENDEEKMERFFNLIDDMLEERKRVFRGGNYSQYFRTHGAEYPAIFIFIDNFASFKEKTEDAYVPNVMKISKEGVGNGIYLVMSAAGYNTTEIPSRLGENMGTAIGLCLADKFAYGDILRDIRVDVMPEAGFKGRGLCYVGNRILEIQIAQALEAADDYKRMEAITENCKIIAKAWSGVHARPIPEIPENPTWNVFKEHPDVLADAETDNIIPIGYRTDNALISGLDMYKNYCFMICGAAHTGKKSMMRLMILSALMKKDAKVVIIDDGRVFNDFESLPNVRMIHNGEELYDWCFNELTPMFKERNVVKKRLFEAGFEGDEYYEEIAEFNSVFVFISSLTWFIKAVYNDSHGMKGFMETIFKKGENHKIAFIGSIDINERTEVGGFEVFNAFASYHTGIHLGGEVTFNSWLGFEYLKPSEQIIKYQQGTGLLSSSSGGNIEYKVIIPLAKKAKKKLVT
ncbi:type VII secretion protein EssC [Butyrivibrio sp. XPD2002]|uniref:type VII secretion protein EssC n=1 Tax=Butyrivibrio sp. XPD2002 TaxID=1280665 RepID=UPI000417A9E6|nr:type VII secretion protein EssC [Butyrivibrio sp. XPD2002]